MKRRNAPTEVTGTRDELIEDLEDTATGAWHLARDRQASDSWRGVTELREGAGEVQVGHTVYKVTD